METPILTRKLSVYVVCASNIVCSSDYDRNKKVQRWGRLGRIERVKETQDSH